MSRLLKTRLILSAKMITLGKKTRRGGEERMREEEEGWKRRQAEEWIKEEE